MIDFLFFFFFAPCLKYWWQAHTCREDVATQSTHWIHSTSFSVFNVFVIYLSGAPYSSPQATKPLRQGWNSEFGSNKERKKRLPARKKRLLARILTKARKCPLRQNATKLCVNMWGNAQYRSAKIKQSLWKRITNYALVSYLVCFHRESQSINK